VDCLHEDLNRVKKKPYVPAIEDEAGKSDQVLSLFQSAVSRSIRWGKRTSNLSLELLQNFRFQELAEETWRNFLARNDSVVVDLFHGQIRSSVKCPDCDKLSVTFDPVCYYSLPLPTNQMKKLSYTLVPYVAGCSPSRVRPFNQSINQSMQLINQCNQLIDQSINQCNPFFLVFFLRRFFFSSAAKDYDSEKRQCGRISETGVGTSNGCCRECEFLPVFSKNDLFNKFFFRFSLQLIAVTIYDFRVTLLKKDKGCEEFTDRDRIFVYQTAKPVEDPNYVSVMVYVRKLKFVLFARFTSARLL
jgi:hypothetical protein